MSHLFVNLLIVYLWPQWDTKGNAIVFVKHILQWPPVQYFEIDQCQLTHQRSVYSLFIFGTDE